MSPEKRERPESTPQGGIRWKDILSPEELSRLERDKAAGDPFLPSLDEPVGDVWGQGGLGGTETY